MADMSSLNAPKTPASIKLALTNVSAKTAAISGYVAGQVQNPNQFSVLVTTDTNCFILIGPTTGLVALADGTDHFLLANIPTRILGLVPGDCIAAILGTGTGNMYITPEGA